jgi:hypothetical protein
VRKNTVENKLVLSVALVFLLVFVLIIFVGCKKKEQSQEAQSAAEAQKTKISEKIGLRILYAGLPNTDREKDFVDFLKKHFQQVETTDYYAFTGSYTADFDVAIIDHNGLGFNVPTPKIPRQYSRATVTVGVPGAFLCDRLSLKTGYL